MTILPDELSIKRPLSEKVRGLTKHLNPEIILTARSLLPKTEIMNLAPSSNLRGFMVNDL
jgi:hypothetical protein